MAKSRRVGVSLLVLAVAACGPSDEQVRADDLEDEVIRLRSKLADAQAYAYDVSLAAANLEFAVSAVESNVDGFDYYEWGSVVSNVRSSVGTLGWQARALRTSVDELGAMLAE